LRLKNPWADESWKGRYSSNDLDGWSDIELRNEVGYDPLLSIEEEDDGIFWVCWDDILVFFQNFYLSWNPNLFAHRHVAHGFWPYDQGPKDDSINLSENPQYTLSFPNHGVMTKATLWILISRHIARQELLGYEVCYKI
jgi:calpain-7